MINATSRNLNIDAFRVIGFVAVVILHSISNTSGNITAGNVFTSVLRWSVPCFFMVSGYLISYSEKPIIFKIKANFIRIIPLILLWVSFYSLFTDRAAFEGPKAFLLSVVSGGSGYHLWFLFALLCSSSLVIILSPLGNKILLSAGLAFFTLGLAFGPYRPILGLPEIPWFWGIEFKPRWGPILGTLFVAIGYVAAKLNIKPTKPQAFILIGCGVILQLLEMSFLYTRTGWFGPYDFLIGTVPLSVGIGGLVLLLQPSKLVRTIAKLGPSALGAYCLHVTILKALFPVRPLDLGLQAFVVIIVVSTTSLAISYPASKIKILEKFFS